VRHALDVLHGIGFVHMDVAPNNILRVEGTWKLADLDSCVPRGTPSARGAINQRYLHPDREGAVPARDEFDDYGLEQVLARFR
jgi:serine/threonine protein kinase